MKNVTKKVNELLDIAANDYASENQQHDLSAQYLAFISGGFFMKILAIEFVEWCSNNNYVKSNGDCWIDEHCDNAFESSDLAFEYFVNQKLNSKKDEGLEECTSCDKMFKLETMKSDSQGNWFCPECWKELAPVMKSEYEEMVQKGEI